MTTDLVYIIVSLSALATAFVLGPTVLAARGVLRSALGPDIARSRASVLTLGIAFGAAAATVFAGLNLGGPSAVHVTCLTLLLMLASMDLSWRWLPLEWTVPLLALGLGASVLSGDMMTAAFGAALGGGVLLALRTIFLVLRGVEAMGLGDVWLAAALGAFVGPWQISWLLGAAACLGLLLHFVAPDRQIRRFGVAFGAHMCVVTPIFL